MKEKETIQLMTPMTEEEKQAYSLEKRRQEGNNYTYLILFNGVYKDNEDTEYRDWQIVKGRQATYDMIKEILYSQDDVETDILIDVSTSYIIAEPPYITENTPRITFENMLSVYAFMQKMLINSLVVDDSSFSIEDYYDGE